MNLLIVGCGDLGGRVAKLCLERGDRVHGVRRDAAQVPRAVHGISADVARPDGLDFPTDIDAMVYAIAATERTDGGYERAYPRGLANALGALDRTSPGVPAVFVSSTAAYGENGGEWVDEDTPPRPERFSGIRMVEAEEVLASRGRSTSIRLAGIYGPGRTRLIEQVRARGESDARSAPAWTNRIHVDDAARAIVHLVDLHLESKDTPSVLNGVDQEPALRSSVEAFIAERLRIPWRPAAVLEGQEESRPASNKRVRGDRLLGTGFGLQYPTFREGYGALIGT